VIVIVVVVVVVVVGRLALGTRACGRGGGGDFNFSLLRHVADALAQFELKMNKSLKI
jgi:hypothetical protein